MKRKKTLNKLAALLLSAVMALSLNTAVLAAETNRHAAIDKTAAELKDGRTDVTLAIGAGSEKTSSDVVFVLDLSLIHISSMANRCVKTIGYRKSSTA